MKRYRPIVLRSVSAGVLLLTYLLEMAFSASVCAQSTLDLAQVQSSQREIHRAIAIDDQVYFESTRPIATGPSYLPYTTPAPMKRALAELMVVPLDGSKPPRPLVDSPAEGGFSFADPLPVSPDGQRIGVLHQQGWRITAGVVELGSGELQMFDDVLVYTATGAATFFWLSNTEILLLARMTQDSQDEFLSAAGRGPQLRAAAREAAWNGSVSSSALGSGLFDTGGSAFEERALIKVDLASGEKDVLWSAQDLGQLKASLSPSRQFIYISFTNDGGTNLQCRERYAVVNLNDGSVLDLSEAYGVGCIFSAWERETDELLLYGTSFSDRRSGDSFFSFNARTGEVVSFNTGLAALSTGGRSAVNRPSIDQIRQAMWIDSDKIAYRQSTSSTRSDWVLTSKDGESRILTSGLASVPDIPIAKSDTHLFFLIDGDVVAVDFHGDTHSLSEGAAPLKRIRIHVRGTSTESPRFSGNFTALSDVIFEEDQSGAIGFMSEQGGFHRLYEVPGPNAELLHVSRHSVVYMQHKVGEASQLLASRSSTNAAYTLHSLNKHLVDIQTANTPIRVAYPGPNDETLFGWLFSPAGASFARGAKFPLVVIVYAEVVYPADTSDGLRNFDPPWAVAAAAPISTQLFTAAGYAVLLPSIPLNWPPSDPMIDIMPPLNAAVDAALATGFIDSGRLALTGHSFGGFTSLSVAVQSNRFNAIIASAGASDLIGQYSHFNEADRFQPTRSTPTSGGMGQYRMGGAPWNDEQRFLRNSPLFSAENVESSVLLIHGDLDFVHIQQSEAFYTALVEQGKNAVFLRYWGEGHTILQPQNQIDMWNRVFDFLEDNGVEPQPKTVH